MVEMVKNVLRTYQNALKSRINFNAKPDMFVTLILLTASARRVIELDVNGMRETRYVRLMTIVKV